MNIKRLFVTSLLLACVSLLGCSPAATSQPAVEQPVKEQPAADPPIQPAEEQPATESPIQPAGPKPGTPMGWVDGSTLIFIPDPKGADYYGSKGFWITFLPISNYQFSLCVQSGVCANPGGEGFENPEQGSDPVRITVSSIVGPDHPADYCGWIFGREPSLNELRLYRDTVKTGLKGSDLSFEDLGLRPAGIFSIQDDTVHCIVDSPVPLPLFARTTPYYNPRISPVDMEAQVSSSQAFCQNNLGYQTLDMEVPPNHRIQTVTGGNGAECDVLENNRIICYGPSNTNPQIEVGFLCDGFGVFECQPGTTLENGACSGFIIDTGRIEGLKDWKLDSSGILIPIEGEPLSGGAWMGPITQSIRWVNGMIVVENSPVSSLPNTAFRDMKISFPNVSSQMPAAQTSPVYSTSSPCPQGYYPSINSLTGSRVCVSLPSNTGGLSTGGGSQNPAGCMKGYRYNNENMRCEVIKRNGNYPGCSIGSLYYVPDALCDIRTTILSPARLIHVQSFQLALPSCDPGMPDAPNSNGSEESNDPGGLVCSPGQELVCPDPGNPASCYCK